MLFKAFDADMDNKVVYAEFIKPIIGELSPRRMQYIEAAFKMIDKDADEKITKDDIARAFDGLKHPDVKQGKKTQQDILHEVLEMLDLSVALNVLTLHV